MRRSWPGSRGIGLSFEITEGTMMHNSPCAVSTLLTRLRDLHIGLDIDDFGTGYSSFSQLQHLPVQTLKIDRAFVSRIGLDGDSLEIVRTIVALAHNLGMDLIAEGVETAQQLAQLRALDCEYAQGFYFGKPTDRETAWSLIPAAGAKAASQAVPGVLAPPPTGAGWKPRRNFVISGSSLATPRSSIILVQGGSHETKRIGRLARRSQTGQREPYPLPAACFPIRNTRSPHALKTAWEPIRRSCWQPRTRAASPWPCRDNWAPPALTAERIDVTATVSLEKTESGFAITESHLELKAKIPGADPGGFRYRRRQCQGRMPGFQAVQYQNHPQRRPRKIACSCSESRPVTGSGSSLRPSAARHSRIPNREPLATARRATITPTDTAFASARDLWFSKAPSRL